MTGQRVGQNSPETSSQDARLADWQRILIRRAVIGVEMTTETLIEMLEATLAALEAAEAREQKIRAMLAGKEGGYASVDAILRVLNGES